MANIDAPSGFKPVRYLSGAPYTGAHTQMAVLSGDATALFVGDLVKLAAASGVAGVFINGQDTEGMPACIKDTSTTTGQTIWGVVVGFLPDPTNLTLKYRAASTNRIALVVPVQGVVFEAQEDATTSQLAAADMNLNIGITQTAGSTTTGISAVELTSNSKNTTITLPCRLLGLAKRSGNAFNTAGADTDNAKFEVIFNTYAYADNTVGV
jgi:hypothetical protein